MWDRTYETIGAYNVDNAMLCPTCNDKCVGTVSVSYSVAALNEEFWEEGLDCGGCGAEIVPSHENEDTELYLEGE